MNEGPAPDPGRRLNRLHSTNDFYRATSADRDIRQRALDTPARHVWIGTVDGHVPGLLLAWD